MPRYIPGSIAWPKFRKCVQSASLWKDQVEDKATPVVPLQEQAWPSAVSCYVPSSDPGRSILRPIWEPSCAVPGDNLTHDHGGVISGIPAKVSNLLGTVVEKAAMSCEELPVSTTLKKVANHYDLPSIIVGSIAEGPFSPYANP